MSSSKKSAPRHQCVVYDGSPPRLPSALAVVMRIKLQQNYRCIYFDSPLRITRMRCYLAAMGVYVRREIGMGRLVLLTDQQHLSGGCFDPERMLFRLEVALYQALSEGYAGLWASGDMHWQMGPRMDYSRILEYEKLLESFFEGHPKLSGICQYHLDRLPREAARKALLSHQSIFVSENLSLINPYFMRDGSVMRRASEHILLDAAIDRLCASDDAPAVGSAYEPIRPSTAAPAGDCAR